MQSTICTFDICIESFSNEIGIGSKERNIKGILESVRNSGRSKLD